MPGDVAAGNGAPRERAVRNSATSNGAAGTTKPGIGPGTGFDADVLIVGAGPTGLALARELHTLGVAAMIIDKAPDAVHESRALAIQARTLEVLSRNGLADDLVSAGTPAATLLLHGRGRRRRRGTRAAPAQPTRSVPLFDTARSDTRFPFLLFLSQASTERVLVERLASAGVGILRGLTLAGMSQDDHGVTCTLESPGVAARTVRTRYVVGCDGAHSATRRLAGIGFSGRTFPQRFLLADVEADGVQPGPVHAYLAGPGPLLLFPLGFPARWRLIVMLPPGRRTGPVTLPLAQAAVTRYTRDRITLHDPAWLTEFTISSRLADSFLRGRVFLAGDAAHIHSPAGAQGMNTGIQDAVNLGWKLALVCRGAATPALLKTYELERMPVARSVLAATGRAFTVATSQNPVIRSVRAGLVVRVASALLHSGLVRRIGFRLLSELSIHYRQSPLSTEGPVRPGRGPRSGERYPQPGMDPAPPAEVGAAADGRAPSGPRIFRMLLCGPAATWSNPRVQEFQARWAHLLSVELVPSPPPSRWSAGWSTGWSAGWSTGTRRTAHARNRPEIAQYLVRWDGYVGYRNAGTDLDGVTAYLVALGARPLPQ